MTKKQSTLTPDACGVVLTVEQVSGILGIGEHLCRTMIRRGDLPQIKGTGRRLLVPRAAVEKLLRGE